MGHQHFLFLQGLPGTGKSQLVMILLKLMHTYATLLRDSWMIKGGEKRFDMAAVVGKRMGLSDETQKGSTLDETRLCNVAGAAALLRAEIKGGREFDFPNTVKLILAGNHRPNHLWRGRWTHAAHAAARDHEQAHRAADEGRGELRRAAD
jgi:phage/plasmid-associated DNA primase